MTAVRPAETLTDAAQRTPETTPEEEARFAEMQIAFGKTPRGALLIDRVARYQVSMQPRLESLQETIRIIVKGALAEAHRVADAYAREKGVPPPYSNR